MAQPPPRKERVFIVYIRPKQRLGTSMYEVKGALNADSAIVKAVGKLDDYVGFSDVWAWEVLDSDAQLVVTKREIEFA